MRVGLGASAARINVNENITALWTFAHANGISLDDIIERTSAAGVTIDGLLVKDSGIPEAAVRAHEAALVIGAASIAAVNQAVVTAHEAALVIAGTQIPSLPVGLVTAHEAALVIEGTQIPSLPAALVTAHEAALTILLAQITGIELFARLADAEVITGLYEFAHAEGLKTDDINERTGGAGVTIDGGLLKDGAFASLLRATVNSLTLRASVTGDSVDRFVQTADGAFEWGSGSAARDTQLFRASDDRLKTPNALEVGGVLDLGGPLELSIRTISPFTVDQHDLGIGTVVIQRMSSTTPIDISGFAGGVSGRQIIILNWNVQTITLKHLDVGSNIANRMQLPGSADIILSQNDSVTLFHEPVNDIWHVSGTAL